MSSSSVSTYLDVTQAAKGSVPPSRDPSAGDPEFTGRAARVLAAIHAGTEVVAELPERTGLTTSECLRATSWLAESRLIELDESNGVLRARLTAAARDALAA